MPDFSPDYTPRYIVHYLSAGINHHFTLRGYRGESASATGGRARNALFDMLSPITNWLPADFAWLNAEYVPMDTNIGTPDSIPATVTGGALLADFSKEVRIRTIGYVGRSAATPMRLYVFGNQFDTDDPTTPVNPEQDFRVYATEVSQFATSIAGLNNAGLAANNNLPGAFYQYVNLKVNDYWLRKVRSGGV